MCVIYGLFSLKQLGLLIALLTHSLMDRRMGAVQSNFHQSVGWISARQSWQSSESSVDEQQQQQQRWESPTPKAGQSIWTVTSDELKESRFAVVGDKKGDDEDADGEVRAFRSRNSARLSTSSNESLGIRNLDSVSRFSHSRSPSLESHGSRHLSPSNQYAIVHGDKLYEDVIDEQSELINQYLDKDLLEDDDDDQEHKNQILKEKKVVQIGDAQICEYFIMGKCRYKSKCKRSHNLTICPHCSETLPIGKIACSTHLSRCWKLHHQASSPDF
jgi:hypothetical protein